MATLEGSGWSKFKQDKCSDISDVDIKAAFKLVDVDKSGEISKTVRLVNLNSLFIPIFKELKMACKFLGKRYGVHDVGFIQFQSVLAPPRFPFQVCRVILYLASTGAQPI